MDQKHMTLYEDFHTCVHHWNCLTKQWDVERAGADPEAWWIQNPDILPDSDPKYLCEICRHIDFSLLLQDPGILLPSCSNSRENYLCIDLGRLVHTVERSQCAFCRLIIWKVSQKRAPHLTRSKIFAECQELPGINPDSRVKLSVVMAESSKSSGLRVRITYNNQLVNEDFFLHQIGKDPGQGREVSLKIDRSLPRSWLETCELSHASYPAADWTSLGIDLDFIDTRDSCIATVVHDRRYAALSYVWGGNQSVQLNSQTGHLLRTRNGLKKVRLPETIRDAIRLTKSLGLRYLWVDSICIVQDDKKRRDRLLSRMGWIYENASITIVAASNKSARQGLAGVKSVARTVSQIVTEVQGIKLAVGINYPERPLEDVKIAEWSMRGWTFQEGLLSRRLLFLTARQMVFVCKHETCFEDINDPRLLVDKKLSINGPKLFVQNLPGEAAGELVQESQQGLLRDSGWRWDTYCQLVEEISLRQFSYSEDIIPALAGILKRLSQDLPLKYLFHLPETEIDESLLWQPQGELVRRNFENGEYIPTWSWAGWIGGVTYGATNNHPPKTSSKVNESILWPLRSEIRWVVEDDVSLEEIEINSQDYRIQDWKASGWKHTTTRGHKFLRHYYFHDQLPGQRFLHPVAVTASQKSKVLLIRNSGALCFVAMTANIRLIIKESVGPIQEPGTLSLVYPQITESGESNWAYGDIYDTAGIHIGSIKLMSHNRNDPGNLQLIVLSRCNTKNKAEIIPKFYDDPLECSSYFDKPATTDVLNNPPGMPNHPNIEYGDGFRIPFDEARYKNSFYCIYNVMLVEVESRVAYRIGLGKVHIDGFRTAAFKWKRIELR